MAWSSGTQAITAGQQATSYYGPIQTALAANAAFSLVEDYTSGAVVYHVWKCLGTANGKTDFYIIFAASDTNSSIYCFVAETYDVTTHSVTRPTRTYGNGQPGSANVDATTNALYGTLVSALGNNGGAPTFGTDAAYYTLTCGTGSVDYWIRTSSRGVTFTWRNGTTFSAAWLGMFNSLVTAYADPFPIAFMDLASGSLSSSFGGSVAGAATRAPGADGTYTYYQQVCGGLSGGNSNLSVGSAQGSTYGTAAIGGNKDLFAVGGMAFPVYVCHAMQSSTTGLACSWRGTLPGIVGGLAGSGLAVADTFTIGGHTYLVSSVAGNPALYTAVQEDFA